MLSWAGQHQLWKPGQPATIVALLLADLTSFWLGLSPPRTCSESKNAAAEACLLGTQPMCIWSTWVELGLPSALSTAPAAGVHSSRQAQAPACCSAVGAWDCE